MPVSSTAAVILLRYRMGVSILDEIILLDYWDKERTEAFIQEIFLKKGLYEKIPIDGNYNEFLEALLFEKIELDVYCPECKNERLFRSKARRNNLQPKPFKTYFDQAANNFEEDKRERLEYIVSKCPEISRVFVCPKNISHVAVFTFILKENFLIKVGQYPSFLDINYPDLKSYEKVLGKDKFKEYKEALRLHSNGVSIGAFVYLRRIFEGLLKEAAKEMSQDSGISYDELIKQRTEDLIKQLEGYLPEFLVENRKLYKIISAGIHELTEESCRDIFDDIKTAIEVILKDRVEKREHIKKTRESGKALQKIRQDIKKGTIK